MALETDVVLLIMLFLLSGVFSGSEAALLSLTKAKVRSLRKKNPQGAKELEDIKSQAHKLLTTLLLGNNLVNVAASALTTKIMLGLFPENIALGVATGGVTLVVLVFGEITPKSLAIKHSVPISLAMAKPLKLMMFVLSPLIAVLSFITDNLARFLGAEAKHVMTEEEVQAMVSIGAEEGAIREEEMKLIHRVFQFNDIAVSEVMTPRTEIVGVALGSTVEDVARLLKENPPSRMPVYRENLDNIVGVLYLRDIFAALEEGRRQEAVERLMKPPLFVPPTKKLDRMLSEFQKCKVHLAVVVGEYGEVQGILSIEDLLEELVGEIEDETDVEEEIQQVGANVFEVEGSAELSRINAELNASLTAEGYNTISGFVLSKLGRIPKTGEVIETAQFRIVVGKVSGPKIESLKLVKK